MSKVEALRARIAQDELQAYRAMLGYPEHIAAWDPVRVLAECQSKRRRIDTILAQLEEWATGWHDSRDREKAVGGLLELLRLER